MIPHVVNRLISVRELRAVAIKHLVELSVEHEFFYHFFSKRKICHEIAFQLTELFQIEIDAVIYTDQFTCYIGTWTRRLKFTAILNATLGLI